MSSVGAFTLFKAMSARSGLLPRETMAFTRSGLRAAASSAAPAPIFVPKYPMGRPAASASSFAHRVAPMSRLRQEVHIETQCRGKRILTFFVSGKEIEQQGRKLLVVELSRYDPIPAAEAAAAASLSE